MHPKPTLLEASQKMYDLYRQGVNYTEAMMLQWEAALYAATHAPASPQSAREVVETISRNALKLFFTRNCGDITLDEDTTEDELIDDVVNVMVGDDPGCLDEADPILKQEIARVEAFVSSCRQQDADMIEGLMQDGQVKQTLAMRNRAEKAEQTLAVRETEITRLKEQISELETR